MATPNVTQATEQPVTAAAHAKEVAGYLAQCLGLLPMSVYLSAEQRQHLHEQSGGSGKRLRFDPEFADPSSVLDRLKKPQGATGKKAKKKNRKLAMETAEVAATTPAAKQQPQLKATRAEATRQELQARLQARLDALRAQRKATAGPKPEPGGQSGKQRRSLKRKEVTLKKRVQSLAANQQKQQQQQQQQQQAKEPGASYNKEGKMLFSKFDLVAKEELLGSDTTGSRRAAAKLKHRQKLLERRLVPTGTVGAAAGVGDRLERLKATAGPEKAARLAEKARWEKAMARAEGVKVKDDPTKLARTAKRQASLRRAKARKWQEREEGVQKRQTERQERRQANIKLRKDARVKKKIERAKKKGRILPELHGGGGNAK